MTTQSPARRRWPAGLLVLPAVVPTLVVLGLGLGMAGAQSLGLAPLAGPAAFSVDSYAALTATSAVLDGLVVTLGIATASTAIALVLGFAIAVRVRASRLGGRVLGAVAAATVPLPHLLGAAAFGLLLADSGLAARLVGAEPGTFPALVAGPWWVAVVAEYAWKESAFVALVVLGSLAAIEPGLDETAAVLGARPGQRTRLVTLPLAAPALTASGTIAFAYVVGSYEVAWLLGRTYPEPLPVLALRLFRDTDLTTRPAAMAVALVTVAVALAALLVGGGVLARTTRHGPRDAGAAHQRGGDAGAAHVRAAGEPR